MANIVYTCLLVVASLQLSFCFRVAENVVFEKTQDVSVVRSKWIFSFFTDLRAYQVYMNKLKDQLDAAEDIMSKTIGEDQTHNAYVPIYRRQRRELGSVRDIYRVAAQELQDVIDIQQPTRLKRSILPLGGKILNFLFGTLTKADLRKINNNINLLATNQEQIAHVLNDSLSIVNMTRVEVRENRHAINQLAGLVEHLDMELHLYVTKMRRYLVSVHSFLYTYTRFDMMLAELRESAEKALFYISNVRMQLNQLSLGHLSPVIIPPKDLKRILSDIEKHIPNYLMLPKPTTDTWYYYNTLTCTTVVQDRRFITLVNLPLLEIQSQLEVFQIHNIPLPYNDTGMTALFELESPALAVNVKRTEFILLTEADLARCSNPAAKFCTLQNPMFKLADSELCVVALFKQQQSAITQYCQTRVQIGDHKVNAVYIPDGNWLIVGTKSLLFTIMCLEGRTYQKQTRPPMSYLEVAAGCEAYSDDLTLPPFYRKQSHYDRTEQRDALLTLQNSSFQLWRELDRLPNLTDLIDPKTIPQLTDMKDVPINDLVDKLKSLKKVQQLKEKLDFWDYISYLVIPLIVLCILLSLWAKFSGKTNCCKKLSCCSRLHEAMIEVERCNTELKIKTETDADHMAGAAAESAKSVSTESAYRQPVDGPASVLKPAPLILQLDSAKQA